MAGKLQGARANKRENKVWSKKDNIVYILVVFHCWNDLLQSSSIPVILLNLAQISLLELTRL